MSFALKLDHTSMFGAARGRLNSLRWRVGVGFVFATGASLVLNSVLLGFGWLLALCAAMSLDYWIGNRYLQSREASRKAWGVSFILACAATICVFATMTIWVAIDGGPAGRVLSVLMSASSLVSVMLFLFQAPLFMLITAVPCTLCLLLIPLIPFAPSHASPIEGGLGLACGIAAFMAYVARAAVNNGKMFKGLEHANDIAKERAEEAEAKRAEAEEANRAKSEFLATMTHELRTPLNAVIGYSEIIAEDSAAEGRNDLAEDATRITAAARHLLGLIDQVLQLSTMDSANAAVAIGSVDVRVLVQDAVAGMSEQALAAGNRIAIRIAPSVGAAHTDGQQLALCVSHLLSNAVKFTAGGLIAINVDCENRDGREWLRIAVSDTGVGMAPEQIDRAFQPFTQLDGSATRTQGGMGLGLAVTTAAAHMLGGDVSAVSEPGKGSTFTLCVPMQHGLATHAHAFAAVA